MSSHRLPTSSPASPTSPDAQDGPGSREPRASHRSSTPSTSSEAPRKEARRTSAARIHSMAVVLATIVLAGGCATTAVEYTGTGGSEDGVADEGPDPEFESLSPYG